jgi:hypothetical protein
MGKTCCTYGGEERCIQDFGGGNLRERGNFEDVRVDNIKMSSRNRLTGVEWIDLAQDRDKWWAVVSTVMKLRVA